jgi:hypothetical protein
MLAPFVLGQDPAEAIAEAGANIGQKRPDTGAKET